MSSKNLNYINKASNGYNYISSNGSSSINGNRAMPNSTSSSSNSSNSYYQSSTSHQMKKAYSTNSFNQNNNNQNSQQTSYYQGNGSNNGILSVGNYKYLEEAIRSSSTRRPESHTNRNSTGQQMHTSQSLKVIQSAKSVYDDLYSSKSNNHNNNHSSSKNVPLIIAQGIRINKLF